MLSMKAVRKTFRSGLIETHALRDFDLTVDSGEFVSVTGPSGSGKTSFLNIAGLLDDFDHGEYWLDGENVSHLPDREKAKIRNNKIGFIFQGFNLIPDLNVFDNIAVPLRYRSWNRKKRQNAIEETMAKLDLDSRRSHFPGQLSGGQQQRVAIARAIVGKPSLILADEPTGNLDSVMARQIMRSLEGINASGTTVIMVTHDITLVRQSTRNIQIIDGQIVDFKRAANVHHSPVF